MKTRPFLFLFFCLLAGLPSLPAQNTAASTPRQGPEALVRELYALVTFPAGQTPDWERVRALFIEEAVIVLRTSRDSTTVFSVDGFIGDFQTFIRRAKVEETGFTEHIVRLKPMVFGDMAQVLVLYEASIPGVTPAPQQGVDNFLLIRQAEHWRIVAITNELPRPNHPLPRALRE